MRIVDKLKGVFGGASTAVFHEDDFCQQQLLPDEVRTHVEHELVTIEEFSRKHQAGNGVGWTDVYCRKEPSFPFASLGINFHQLDSKLREVMPSIPAVLCSTGISRIKCSQTLAWGIPNGCVIFADYSETGVVTEVWTSFFDKNHRSIEMASQAINALGTIRPMIYVDWEYGYQCPANEPETFARLLSSKLAEVERRMLQFKNRG